MAFTYPTGPLDEPEQLAALIGSFWSGFYGGTRTVNSYLGARAQIEKQSVVMLNDVVAATGRHTINPFQTVRWLPLTINQSQKLPGRVLTYGYASTVYGNQPITGDIYTFGGPADTTVGYSVPSYIHSVPVIVDQIISSTVTLTSNIDYLLDTLNDKLVFLTDPFLNPAFSQSPVYDASGNIIDQQITLWLFYAKIDNALIYQQFGYVLGLQLPSSYGYREILNDAWDALIGGSSTAQIQDILATYTGAPLAVGNETVLYITADNAGILVITTANIYRYGSGANVIVTVGTALSAGQPIVDTVQVYTVNNGAIPPVGALSLGSGFLNPTINGALVFPNAQVPVSTTISPVDGHVIATFPLGGNPTDVTTFFNLLDAKGVAAGVTLADVLTTPTVNPMQFVIQNVLRFNTFFAVINTNGMGPDATGLSTDTFLRKLIPPSVSLLMLVECTGLGDSISMANYEYYIEGWAVTDALAPQSDSEASGLGVDAFYSIINN